MPFKCFFSLLIKYDTVPTNPCEQKRYVPNNKRADKGKKENNSTGKVA
ncbi:hypothetical protein bcgnr5386_23360 [Bacillus cereus]